MIMIMVPLNKVIASWMGRLQSNLMKATDFRVEINNEVLGNMKGIKLQAWEDSFQKRILSLRNVELKQLFRYVMANSISIMVRIYRCSFIYVFPFQLRLPCTSDRYKYGGTFGLFTV